MTGKSGKGTARQTIRVDEQVWERFRVTCEAAGGQDRSAVVRAFINWFNGEPDAELPTRPELATAEASTAQAIEIDEEN